MKRNNLYKLPAFTIMEVTISMLVSAVVIGITYTSYTIVSKSYLSFEAKNEEMAIFARLDQLLKRDFTQANLITANGGQVLVEKANRPSVTYEFINNDIIRKAVTIDTFKTGYANYKIYFKGLLKSEEDNNQLTAENAEANRIDELAFDVVFRQDTVLCRYIKVYSSANLIKRNPDAVN